jgi:hypothetical protein
MSTPINALSTNNIFENPKAHYVLTITAVAVAAIAVLAAFIAAPPVGIALGATALVLFGMGVGQKLYKKSMVQIVKKPGIDDPIPAKIPAAKPPLEIKEVPYVTFHKEYHENNEIPPIVSPPSEVVALQFGNLFTVQLDTVVISQSPAPVDVPQNRAAPEVEIERSIIASEPERPSAADASENRTPPSEQVEEEKEPIERDLPTLAAENVNNLASNRLPVRPSSADPVESIHVKPKLVHSDEHESLSKSESEYEHSLSDFQERLNSDASLEEKIKSFKAFKRHNEALAKKYNLENDLSLYGKPETIAALKKFDALLAGSEQDDIRETVQGILHINEKVAEQAQSAPSALDRIWNFASAIYQTSESIYSTIRSTIDSYREPTTTKSARIKASKYEKLLDGYQSFEARYQNLKIKNANLETVFECQRKVNRNLNTSDYVNQIRDTYAKVFLPALRNAVVESESDGTMNPQLRTLINEICAHLYTSKSFQEENEALLKAITGRDDFLSMKFDEIHNAYSKADASLTTKKMNMMGKSLNDMFGNQFCPLSMGNPPQKMFELDLGNHKLNILGMGCPTIQQSYKIGFGEPPAVLDPIYRGFIRGAPGKKLYVSNQNHLAEEKVRNQVVMNAQDELEDLYAMTINKNSRFYHGEGPDNAIDYKQQILHNFLEKDSLKTSGCYLSPKIIRDLCKAKLNITAANERPLTPKELRDIPSELIINIANELHKILFDNKPTLTKEDRQLFNEVFNGCLVASICTILKIDYVNFTCKDGIDRGMNSLAMFMSMATFIRDMNESPKTKRMLIDTLFTRAYWARKRSIMDERFHNFKHSCKYLDELLSTPEKAEKFKAFLHRIIGVVEINRA